MMLQAIQDFQFNEHSIPLILVSSVILAVGVFVFIQNWKSPVNVSFFFICLCVCLWLYSIAFVYTLPDPVLSIQIYSHLTFLGVVFISPGVYLFSVLWLDLWKKQRKWVFPAFIGSLIFYFLGIKTSLGFYGVRQYYWGYYPAYGLSSQAFLILFFGYFFAAFNNFAHAYRIEGNRVRRTQIKLIAIGFIFSFTGSVDYISKVTAYPFYPFGYLSVFIWIAMVAYAVVRYRAMDIRTAVHTTIMWLLTSSIFIAPIILGVSIGRRWLLHLPAPLFIALVAGIFVLFTLYSRYIQPSIDHFFQRRRWDLMNVLEKFTDELVYLRSLEEVATHIIYTIKSLFYATNITLFIRREDSHEFMPIGDRDFSVKPFSSNENEFLKWLETHDAIILEEFLSIDPRLARVAESGRQYFEKLRVKICLPFVINGRLIGILNIGEKQNYRGFKAHEISFLADFRRNAAIALSNSMRLIAMQENLRRWNEELEQKVAERTQQLQETQTQLIQAEKLATIGTLAGGIAHEINNPLTAVLANAQLLKLTAAEEDMESIALIEEGAKSCQVIIQKLLKYSRKSGPETPFSDVRLEQVLKNVSAFLAYQFKQENVDVTLDLTEDCVISGNANELEQVFTNLLLNARDAIKEIRPQGAIHINLVKKNRSAEVRVVDNGRGMPETIKSKIFDPFFTTKDVGKGTGLGLAVSFSIIKRHGGDVEVLSTVNQGTTFVLKFPLNSSK